MEIGGSRRARSEPGQGASRLPLAQSQRGSSELGQVIVEVLLILPVFLLLVFIIMEIGHLSFRALVLHHAAYEVARIGSLTTLPLGVPCKPGDRPMLDMDKISGITRQILPRAMVETDGTGVQETLKDPQSDCTNYDLVVSITDPVPLLFPLTALVLGTTPGDRVREINAKVRMPIERPLFK